jgi:hypothetical protein
MLHHSPYKNKAPKKIIFLLIWWLKIKKKWKKNEHSCGCVGAI